ncbi:MAG: HEPN domain-containing protein [Chloroflexota bacterium]
MTDVSELESWIAHAEDDYGSAKRLIRGKRPFLYSACFHAQQCAEKYMKALLIFKDQDFPKVHDLSTLNDLCGSAGILIGIDDILLEILSGYAVRTRYPGDEPNLEEAREAIAIAKTIRRFARRFLGLEK